MLTQALAYNKLMMKKWILWAFTYEWEASSNSVRSTIERNRMQKACPTFEGDFLSTICVNRNLSIK